MATRVEAGGIEACVSTINSAIEDLKTAASAIDRAMNEIGNSWEGDAYNNAMNTYDSDYKTLLTTTIPESVDSFKTYINNCKDKIIETDQQLAK